LITAAGDKTSISGRISATFFPLDLRFGDPLDERAAFFLVDLPFVFFG
jgi:hypothetical protein